MDGATLASTEPALELQNVDIRFGGTHAVRAASLRFPAGTVQAIVGENGAGKSTLVKIVAGAIPYRSYTGDLLVDGVVRQFQGIAAAERAGVFLVPQELNVVRGLSIADNLFLNREYAGKVMLDYRTLYRETARWLAAFHMEGVDPTTRMDSLPTGQQQLVKIARAMVSGVRILILDEPTAFLTESEADLLFQRVREFHQHGVTTIYISHRLDEISHIAQFITVMRDGSILETLDAGRERISPRRIVHSMLGRDVDELYPQRDRRPGEVALAVDHLRVAGQNALRPDLVEGCSLDLRRGEIVGVFGLVGSGTSELAASLFGAWQGSVTGEVTINGRTLLPRSPRQAIEAGMAYVSGDRKKNLVQPMSVTENITLASLRSLSHLGRIRRKAELATVKRFVDRLNIKARSIDQPVRELSGGNQQKVVLTKWLVANRPILILEEPTSGVDVGARAEIYALMDSLAADGVAQLLVSSDLDEVIGMSDRVIAFSRGRVVGRWGRADAAPDAVLSAASEGQDDA
ncbi:MAG TPA: sugar ABC transporter ATP-binding protein [Candidatus Limnocylindrales bacterium]|jgi:D-xylose transport system ATP-binding protein